MYCIIGYRKELDYISYDEMQTIEINDVVATFDTKKQAEEYIKKSLLKAAKRQGFYSDVRRSKYRFRKGSLLRDYDTVEIEKYEKDPVPPHNPFVLGF
jgi:hypothetical protein